MGSINMFPPITFEYTDSPEQGFWVEENYNDAGYEDRLGEVHFDKEGFSVTILPFEVYKDYVGSHEYDAAGKRLHLSSIRGNRLPEFSAATAKVEFVSKDKMILRGLALNPLRPKQRTFVLRRKKNPYPETGANSSR